MLDEPEPAAHRGLEGGLAGEHWLQWRAIEERLGEPLAHAGDHARDLRIGADAAAQEPYSALLAQTDTVYWYIVAPFSLPVKAGPKGAKLSCTAGTLLPDDPAHGRYTLVFDGIEAGPTQIVVTAAYRGRTDADTVVVVGERPFLRSARIDRNGNSSSGTDAWLGLRGEIGERYDPSSEWASPFIPADHYQTVVTIRGREVMNRPGTSFHNVPPATAEALTLTDDVRPEDIITRVYWRPNGTSDQTQWKLLLSNQADQHAVIPLERRGMMIGRMLAREGDPEHEAVATLSPDHPVGSTPELLLSDALTLADAPAVESISCPECDRYGILVSVDATDPLHGMLRMDASRLEPLLDHRRELDGQVMTVDITMAGRSGKSVKTFMVTLLMKREGK